MPRDREALDRHVAGPLQTTGPARRGPDRQRLFRGGGPDRTALHAQRRRSTSRPTENWSRPKGTRCAAPRARRCRCRAAPGRNRAGRHRHAGAAPSSDQLEMVDFTGTDGLAKQGNNYFRAADPLSPAAAPSGTRVEQGKLETSNAGSAEAAVRLVSIMRQFEMLQKAVTLGDDMKQAGHRAGGQSGLNLGRRRTHDSSTVQRRQRHDGAADERGQHRQQPGQRQHRGIQDCAARSFRT